MKQGESAPGYWQVVSEQGYLVHAVRSEFETGKQRTRYGVWNTLVRGPTICKKVKGKDSQGFPSLRLRFDAQDGHRERKPLELTNVEWYQSRVPLNFTRNADDFEWMQHYRLRICGDCAMVLVREQEKLEREQEKEAK